MAARVLQAAIHCGVNVPAGTTPAGLGLNPDLNYNTLFIYQVWDNLRYGARLAAGPLPRPMLPAALDLITSERQSKDTPASVLCIWT